ncbi:hypothetical protein T440DRAFT_521426 [Plenodomus tracheiphilus IPT5]|uniref:Uncharacterized protein n=1 Tax=Plenodomus tracheiphilus IPT5 TaxID=1408161 RepID=A0A6A7AU66_9PLEO|nr:hypothetical protein T440DRAFT_521426 [Plenodomus tracheiphilus IPT5]
MKASIIISSAIFLLGASANVKEAVAPGLDTREAGLEMRQAKCQGDTTKQGVIAAILPEERVSISWAGAQVKSIALSIKFVLLITTFLALNA